MKIPHESYHIDSVSKQPSLNASTAIRIVSETPLHAKTHHPRFRLPDEGEKPKRHFDLGKAFHSLLLGKGDPVVVLDFPDYRKKEAREARDEAYSEGKVPMLAKEWGDTGSVLYEMTESAEKKIRAAGYGGDFYLDSDTEHGILVDVDYCPCRILCDCINLERNTVFDLKTTATLAEPHDWMRRAMQMGIDIRVGHYLDVLKAEYDRDFTYLFVLTEKSPPYASAIVELDSRTIALGRSKASVARELWLIGLRQGSWDAWPDEVQLAAASEWAFMDWIYRLQREDREVPATLESEINI